MELQYLESSLTTTKRKEGCHKRENNIHGQEREQEGAVNGTEKEDIVRCKTPPQRWTPRDPEVPAA